MFKTLPFTELASHIGMTSGFGFPFLGGELEEGGEGKCHIRLELTYSMLAGAWNSDLMTMPPPHRDHPHLLAPPLPPSPPLRTFSQLSPAARPPPARSPAHFPRLWLSMRRARLCVTRRRGWGGGSPDALLGPEEPGAGCRLTGGKSGGWDGWECGEEGAR